MPDALHPTKTPLNPSPPASALFYDPLYPENFLPAAYSSDRHSFPADIMVKHLCVSPIIKTLKILHNKHTLHIIIWIKIICQINHSILNIFKIFLTAKTIISISESFYNRHMHKGLMISLFIWLPKSARYNCNKFLIFWDIKNPFISQQMLSLYPRTHLIASCDLTR